MISKDKRFKVYARDSWRCVRCGRETILTIDHKKPKSKGGLSNFENLQSMCEPCNQKKGNEY